MEAIQVIYLAWQCTMAVPYFTTKAAPYRSQGQACEFHRLKC